MCLAFQEVGAKRLGEPDISAFFAVAPLLPCSALALSAHWTLVSGRKSCTAFLYIMSYDAHVLSRKGETKPWGSCLQAFPRYGRVRPRKPGQPSRLPSSGLPSRRSSVVEHVIGNDGVSSSILLGGTILLTHAVNGGTAHRLADISPASRRKPSASAVRPVSTGRSRADLML